MNSLIIIMLPYGQARAIGLILKDWQAVVQEEGFNETFADDGINNTLKQMNRQNVCLSEVS